MNTVNTSPQFKLEYSATSVEMMILGETQDLYHLMFGFARLIRVPLKIISLSRGCIDKILQKNTQNKNLKYGKCRYEHAE
jgi:hypothetical protein